MLPPKVFIPCLPKGSWHWEPAAVQEKTVKRRGLEAECLVAVMSTVVVLN